MSSPENQTEAETSGTPHTIIAVVVVVAIALVAFFGFRFEHNAYMKTQAANVAKLFIKSSPNVEKNLGTVVQLTQKSEARANGAMPGWKVDFNVSGKKAQGTVEMVVRNDGGNWNVPEAKLEDRSSGKTVNLL
ncbi:MAG TPA: cytochrome c oxidase assembly factor Coa1 family protein [Candidatus Binataceae bacterium]|nr:cytochrome c oxidase assembly factor Coa1 family protein [Candidatus Binataceae bacterium]